MFTLRPQVGRKSPLPVVFIKFSASKYQRGIRTKLKEKLYKHIYYRLNKLRPGINIGVSTGITDMEQNWTNPYAQWSFVPAEVEVDQTKTKRYQKGTKK